MELAEKAKNKEDFKTAIDNYLDAIYHLEHDYKGIDKSRDDLIISLKKKVEKLKVKLIDDTGKLSMSNKKRNSP